MTAQRDLKFGWLSPVIGNRWSDHQPIVMFQERNILPTALQHFDSLWIADHFYGFDAKTDPFMEAWTTLTCFVVPPCARAGIPQSGAHSKNGCNIADVVGQQVHTWCWGWLARR